MLEPLSLSTVSLALPSKQTCLMLSHKTTVCDSQRSLGMAVPCGATLITGGLPYFMYGFKGHLVASLLSISWEGGESMETSMEIPPKN